MDTFARPAERGFIPGLALITIGFTVKVARDLYIIPTRFWLEARIVAVGTAILGLVLIERVWAGRKRSPNVFSWRVLLCVLCGLCV